MNSDEIKKIKEDFFYKIGEITNDYYSVDFAMLKCNAILDEFNEIVDKNDPKNFEVVKEENKNFYS